MEIRNFTAKKAQRLLRALIVILNVAAPVVAVACLLSGSYISAILILILAHALFLIPTLIPWNDWCGPVLTQLHEEAIRQRQVWLTIDDGPDPIDTPLLLDLLDEYQAKATFFFIGDKAKQHPHLLHLTLQRGHTIGNHTMTHPQHWLWSYLPWQLKREIQECQQILSSASPSQTPQWFRAPAGFKNPFIHAILESMNLHLACWNARGLDGVERDPKKILNRLLPQIQPGSIILMHEARMDLEGQRLAPQILESILNHLKKQQLHPICPVISIHDYE